MFRVMRLADAFARDGDTAALRERRQAWVPVGRYRVSSEAEAAVQPVRR
jgi:hypothetical protein